MLSLLAETRAAPIGVNDGRLSYRLTRTLRTVLRLSLRMLTVTLTSSPCVYQPLSRLALKPTRPSCSRNGLSTAPWGPPQGPTLMPPMPPVTPALLWGGSISEPVLSQCCQGNNQIQFTNSTKQIIFLKNLRVCWVNICIIDLLSSCVCVCACVRVLLQINR